MITQVRPALQSTAAKSHSFAQKVTFLAGYETMNVETDKSFPSESATTYIFGSAYSTVGREVVDSSVDNCSCERSRRKLFPRDTNSILARLSGPDDSTHLM